MIKLSAYDMNLVNRIEAGLKKCVGKSNAATSKFMISKLKAEGFTKVSGPKIREIIHYLRTHRRMFICGDSNGYYMPTGNEEREIEIKSLTSRINQITEVRDALKKIHNSQFKQEEMFG